jgi:hypothetical protein
MQDARCKMQDARKELFYSKEVPEFEFAYSDSDNYRQIAPWASCLGVGVGVAFC